MPRAKKKYHYLYKTTNLINEKYYYGMHSTSNLKDEYLGSGTYLRRSIRKHGKENFKLEIIKFYKDREELKNAEKELVNEDLIKESLCMNLKTGGYGGFSSKEHQLKCSKAGSDALSLKFKTDENYRIEHCKRSSIILKQNHKDGKMRHDTFTNKEHSEATKKLMSEKAQLRTGDKNSSYGTCWIMNDVENKKIKKEDLDTYLIQGWIKGRK